MKPVLYSLLLILLLSVPALALQQQSILTGAHGQDRYLLKSCRACHRGMKMAIRNEENSCLSCHGNALQQREMVAAGYLRESGMAGLRDIEQELQKPYRHPVLTVGGVHQRNELLPETLMNAARHAECVDCHEPHQVSGEHPFSGIQGKRVGSFVTEISKEYELCYKCHGQSANLPADSTDKQLEFRLTNKSYHPVEGEGANAFVISLKEPYATRKQRPGDISILSCSDCHGSDSANGPRGPHGSNYRGLLKANYDTEDARPESSYAYELCYKCHERSSILGNESFPYHVLHILGDRGRDLPGTSCFSCHDAHGSPNTPYLIRFNPDVVEENLQGKLEYVAQGVATRHGSCALRCHGVEHEPKTY